MPVDAAAGAGEGFATAPSWLLRAWRQRVAGMTASDAAQALGISAAALSQWETGKKVPAPERVAELDRLYRAQGALVGMINGTALVRSVPARRTWDFNPSAQGGPVWAWAIPSHSSSGGLIRASLGPFRTTEQIPDRVMGLLLTLDVSTANPPVRIEFVDAKGWVAFGPGPLPATLGLPCLDIRKQANVSLRGTPSLHHSLWRIRSLAGGVLGHLADALGRSRSTLEVMIAHIERPGYEAVTQLCATPPAEPGRRVSREVARSLRIERGLSRADLAAQVSRLTPDSPVSSHQIEQFEEGGEPRAAFVASRIDRALELDGSLTLDPVNALRDQRSGNWSVPFPDYWVGPVWVQFDLKPARTAEFTLVWTPWAKKVNAGIGEVAHLRRSRPGQEPLRVVVPPFASVKAGMGYHPQGLDINANWSFATPALAESTWATYFRLLSSKRT